MFQECKSEYEKKCELIFNLWNRLSHKFGYQKVLKLTVERRRNIMAILQAFSIDELKLAYKKLNKNSNVYLTYRWLNFDFLTKNDTNLSKFLEGSYDRAFGNTNSAFTGSSEVTFNKRTF